MARATSDVLEAPGFVPAYADMIGKPFVLGGRGPDLFDCYGLVIEMERRAGRRIPDVLSPADQSAMAELLGSEQCKWVPCKRGPGAVLTFRIGRYVSHVGVMVNEHQFLHALGSGNVGVAVERIEFWERRVVSCLRYVQ